MVTMPGSLRAGQPTKAAVTRKAFAMAMILRIRVRFFMEWPCRDQMRRQDSHGERIGQDDVETGSDKPTWAHAWRANGTPRSDDVASRWTALGVKEFDGKRTRSKRRK